MSVRKERSRHLRATQINQKVSALAESPLAPIANLLQTYLDLSPQLDEGYEQEIYTLADSLFTHLPNQFDDRFDIDAYIIRSITDYWDNDSLRCSPMIIPCYHSQWGYQAFPLQNVVTGEIHRLEFVYIRREEGEDLPYLLDYSWLYHELGHYLWHKHGLHIQQKIRDAVTLLIRNIRKRQINLQGQARIIAAAYLEEIESCWSSNIPSNWSDEICIDVIALWCCGPVYLDSFYEEHKDISHPYLIDPSHPPVGLRTQSLIASAKQLGWEGYLSNLNNLMADWSKQENPNYNRYAALADRDLLDTSVQGAWEFCSSINLPKMTSSQLMNLENEITSDEIEGHDLIIAAWLSNRIQGDNSHDQWEERMLRQLLDDLKL